MDLTRREWVDAFAREAGVAAPSNEEIDQLLALAAIAAHGSERTAAPVACFIAARSTLTLAELLAVSERVGGAPLDGE